MNTLKIILGLTLCVYQIVFVFYFIYIGIKDKFNPREHSFGKAVLNGFSQVRQALMWPYTLHKWIRKKYVTTN